MIEDQAYLIDRASARTALSTFKSGEIASHDALRLYPVKVKTPEGLGALHDELWTICASLKKPESRREGASEFECEGSIAVHRHLRFLPNDLLESTDFWLWLTVFQARDVVYWRHGEEASPGNFGLEARFEGLLCRLFMRAHLVFSDDQEDPYELARKGTQDFWRSFMIRRNFASVKDMARAFARQVNFRDGRTMLTDDQIRQIGPRVTQLNGSYAYEFMDEAQCSALLVGEAEKLGLIM